MSTSPTTKLEAVNIMLSSIGEAPVNSLTSGLEDAELAETILGSVSRDVQSKGWTFNTDLKYTLSPDSVTKEISIPDNCLRVDTRGTVRSSSSDIVERGRKLYDRVNNTSIFSSSQIVDIVFNLEFTDIPEVARRYIVIRSARIFQDRVLASTSIHGFQLEDERAAWMELQDHEGEIADYNIFDNYDTFSVIDRGMYSSSNITNTTSATSS